MTGNSTLHLQRRGVSRKGDGSTISAICLSVSDCTLFDDTFNGCFDAPIPSGIDSLDKFLLVTPS